MENRKKQVLIVAYWYLVENAASGQLQRHFARKLVELGFCPTIICAGKKADKCIDGVRVVSVPENKIIKPVLKVLSKNGLGEYLRLPDIIRFYWNSNALKTIHKLFHETRYDYIHTINNPSSSHLIGLEIKKTYNIPWIAQFYDPWTNNPIETFANKRVMEVNHELEYEVAKNANFILHTNDLMIKYWKDSYGPVVKDKLIRLNLTTEVTLPEFKPQNEKKLVISHIGHFTHYRHSQTFINAVNLIKKEKPHLLDKLEVNYVGAVTAQEKHLIEKYDLGSCIRILGRLSEQDCTPYFIECTMFLVIDTNHNPNVFFPSKILKYFFYQKPILGITTGISVLKEELTSSNNIVFQYGEEAKIADFLMDELENNTRYAKHDKDYWKLFSPDYVLGQYTSLVENMLS